MVVIHDCIGRERDCEFFYDNLLHRSGKDIVQKLQTAGAEDKRRGRDKQRMRNLDPMDGVVLPGSTVQNGRTEFW